MTRSALPAIILFLLAASFCLPAPAQVRVTKQADDKYLLDISALEVTRSSSGEAFIQALRTSLQRSGWFILGQGRAALLLTGRVEQRRGQLQADFNLQRSGDRRHLLSNSYREPEDRARALAHRIADEIVAAVTGRPGFASSRLLMVGNVSGHKELYIADSDGRGLVQLTRDASVSVAPSWGPDGRRLVYTSYLKGFPDVYMIDTISNERRRISSEAGLNTSAAISPDGKSVALILSRDGNPELYIRDIDSGRLTRLTRTPGAVEASPSWSPDGSRLVYVSDTTGRPQLYMISRRGGTPRRLTQRGLENVDPDWGPHGVIAYASRRAGRYVICLLDPEDGVERELPLPDYADYGEPSWAPDGRHLACTRTAQHRSQIYLLDTGGSPPVALTDYKGDWHSPSWSPK